MGFGLAPTRGNNETGLNPSRMFSGFNLSEGIKSKFLGFLATEFKYTEIFGFLVRASTTLTTFDWNATDVELRKQYKDMNEDMAGSWGQVFGRGIGSATAIAMGTGTSLVVPKISGARLAKQVFEASSTQAKEEIIDETKDALRDTKNKAGAMLALEGFIRYRKIMKGLPLPLLTTVYGAETANFIKKGWGAEGGADFKISEKLDEKIESIKDSVVQEFVREAVDGFADSFIDTGYIIAQELDEGLRQYQLGRARIAPAEVLRILPNRENPDESFILEGDTEEEIQDEIARIVNNWRVLNNRDVGQIVTQDLENLYLQPQLRRLEIIFKSVPRPPFVEPDGKRAKETSVTIPNVKRNLSWQKIKTTLKSPSYVWGDGTAVLKFIDKRKIRANFDLSIATSIEGILKEWAELSDGTIKTITASNYLDQPAYMNDSPKTMYPAYGRLINKNFTSLNQTPPSQLEIYKFDLWTEDAPPNFSDNFT